MKQVQTKRQPSLKMQVAAQDSVKDNSVVTATNTDKAGNSASNSANAPADVVPEPPKVTEITISDDARSTVIQPNGVVSHKTFDGKVSDQNGASAPLNGITNDTTPTITVTLDRALSAGETLEIYRGSTLVKTFTSADLTGTQATFTDSITGAESKTYDTEFTYKAKTSQGSLSNELSAKMTLDTEVVPLTIDGDDAITAIRDGSNILKGRAEANSVIFQDTNKNGQLDAGESWVKADQYGNWNFDLNGLNLDNIDPDVYKPQDAQGIDGRLLLKSLDRAGNLANDETQLYYFNTVDHNNTGAGWEFEKSSLSPYDKPQGGTWTSYHDKVNLENDPNIPPANRGNGSYETHFEDDGSNKIIIVEKDITALKSYTGFFTVYTGRGDDSILVGGDIFLYTRIKTGAGKDQVVIRRIDQPSAMIDLGSDDDTLEVTNEVATGTVIYLGEGNDKMIVENSLHGRIDMGNALDSSGNHLEITEAAKGGASLTSDTGCRNEISAGNIYTSSIIGSAGEDIITTTSVTGNQAAYATIHNTWIALGDGNDEIHTTSVRGGIGVFGDKTIIDMGAGDDIVEVDQWVQKANIFLDDGDDILNLGSLIGDTILINGGAGHDVVTINGHTGVRGIDASAYPEIRGVEELNLNGTGNYAQTLHFSPSNIGFGEDNKLVINGNSENKIDLGSDENAGITGWTKSQTGVEENGHTYDVYTIDINPTAGELWIDTSIIVY